MSKTVNKNWGLLEIEHILNKIGRSLREFPPMPFSSSESDSFSTNRLIVEELDYDTASVLREFQKLHAGLMNN